MSGRDTFSAESDAVYVKAVYMLEVSVQLISARTFDAREAAEEVAEQDRKRRVMHEAAIAAVSSCNRMAERFGVQPVFDGNIEDRYEVADFCGDFVVEIFESATSASYSAQPIIDRLLNS